jgi:hypothetical protein
MTTRNILLVAALGCLIVSQAQAQTKSGAFYDGNKLLQYCSPGDTPTHQGICIGYIAGLADALSSPGASINGLKACIPTGVKQGQVMDVAINYLKAHPETRHYTADSLVAQALRDVFPCKGG